MPHNTTTEWAEQSQIDEFIKGGPGRLYYENTDQMRTVQIFKDIYGVGESVALIHTAVAKSR
jgi:hypothetical protein